LLAKLLGQWLPSIASPVAAQPVCKIIDTVSKYLSRGERENLLLAESLGRWSQTRAAPEDAAPLPSGALVLHLYSFYFSEQPPPVQVASYPDIRVMVHLPMPKRPHLPCYVMEPHRK